MNDQQRLNYWFARAKAAEARVARVRAIIPEGGGLVKPGRFMATAPKSEALANLAAAIDQALEGKDPR